MQICGYDCEAGYARDGGGGEEEGSGPGFGIAVPGPSGDFAGGEVEGTVDGGGAEVDGEGEGHGSQGISCEEEGEEAEEEF